MIAAEYMSKNYSGTAAADLVVDLSAGVLNKAARNRYRSLGMTPEEREKMNRLCILILHDRRAAHAFYRTIIAFQRRRFPGSQK
jgi:methyl coenzyme M reductase subunit C